MSETKTASTLEREREDLANNYAELLLLTAKFKRRFEGFRRVVIIVLALGFFIGFFLVA